MTLASGVKLGPYEILAPLGAGGMGEVYRARDTRLGREVAIKVLPEEWAEDPERLRRFEGEARAASALSDPHIVTVFDVGSDAGRPFIAMELIQGKSLRDLLDSGPLPVRKALEIAAQIAEGLAKAHGAGIVHRDLKPENIMVSRDGYAKILDFGLAKLAEAPAGDLSSLPTAAPETAPGIVMGTVAYMSPEQAAGRVVDFRSDQFSLGSILYEIVSGKRAFARATAPETLVSIIREEPEPLSKSAPAIPIPFRWIIERCLAKDPDDRYAATRDMARDLSRLREGLGEASASGPAILPSPARRRRLAAAFGVVLLLLGIAAGWLWWRRPPRIAPQSEWVALTDFSDSVVDPAISSDGRMLAFLRGNDAFLPAGDLYVKLLPAGDAVPLTHDGGRKLFPVFSPDGTRVAYTALDEKGGWNTHWVSVLGGTPQLYLPNSEGLHWIGGGRLLFSEIQGGIHMVLVTAREGRVDQRTIYDPPTDRGMAHLSALSPDGKRVVITEMDAQGEFQRCRLLPFDGRSRGAPIGPPGPCLDAAWSPDGRWVYLNTNAGDGFHLWRVRARGLRPEQITFGPARQNGIAVAPDGSLLTAVGAARSSIWLHQPGTEDREVTQQGDGDMPWFSPDGGRLYYLRAKRTPNNQDEGELISVDLSNLQAESLFPGLGMLGYSLSPDGRQVVFGRRDAHGDAEVWIASLDRRSPPRRVPAPLPIDQPVFAAPDELYVRALDHGKHYLERLRLDGGGRQRIGRSPIAWINAISPDRRWIVVTVPWDSQEAATLRTVAYAADGSGPTSICTACEVGWSPDGGTIDLRQFVAGAAKPVAIPLAAGRAFPELPPQGFASLEDAAKLPGARRVDLPDAFSPRAGTWASVKSMVQRNIYRIPVR